MLARHQLSLSARGALPHQTIRMASTSYCLARKLDDYSGGFYGSCPECWIRIPNLGAPVPLVKGDEFEHTNSFARISQCQTAPLKLSTRKQLGLSLSYLCLDVVMLTFFSHLYYPTQSMNVRSYLECSGNSLVPDIDSQGYGTTFKATRTVRQKIPTRPREA